MFAGDESRVYPPAAGDDQSLPAQLEPQQDRQNLLGNYKKINKKWNYLILYFSNYDVFY